MTGKHLMNNLHQSFFEIGFFRNPARSSGILSLLGNPDGMINYQIPQLFKKLRNNEE